MLEEEVDGSSLVEQRRLLNDFKYHCQSTFCDTIEEHLPDDPRVTIDPCGCIFQNTHLASFLRPKLDSNIFIWFDQGRTVSCFTCSNRDYIVGEKFTVWEFIMDPTDRY